MLHQALPSTLKTLPRPLGLSDYRLQSAPSYKQPPSLVIPGLATHFWGWQKAGMPIASYGYPCYLVGSLLVITGVAACDHIIEGVTREY